MTALDRISTPVWFLTAAATSWVATYYYRVLVANGFLAQQLGGRLVDNDLVKAIAFQDKMFVYGMAWLPAIFLLRMLVVATLLHLPFVVLSMDLPFRAAFRAVVFGSFALALQVVVSTIALAPRAAAGTLTEGAFVTTPLSLASLLHGRGLGPVLLAAAGSVNVFELAWCLIVARSLSKHWDGPQGVPFVAAASMWALFAAVQVIGVYYMSVVFG